MRNNFIKKNLSNGVKLYLYKDSKMKWTVVSYGVAYGSSGVYNDFYLDGKHYHVLPGCAHFLEHLLGEHSKYGNIYSNFSLKKYVSNGITTPIFTNYWFRGENNIYESIKELINSIDDPVFTPLDIKETSHAICEETKMMRGNKIEVARCMCLRNLFSNIEVVSDALTVIGDENTTKAINYDMIKACYDAFYSDDNKFLLIGGNIDVDEITEYIESIYKELKPHPNRYKPYKYSDEGIRKDIQIEYMPTNEDFVVVGFKEKINYNYSINEIYYFLKFIFETKFGESSDFVQKMKQANIISKYEYSDFSIVLDNYCLMFGASTNNYEKYLKELVLELNDFNFNKNDFELFKKTQIAKEAFKLDNKYRVLNNFLLSTYRTDDFDGIDFIKQLTYDRFIGFYKHLDFSKNTVAVIRNPINKNNEIIKD